MIIHLILFLILYLVKSDEYFFLVQLNFIIYEYSNLLCRENLLSKLLPTYLENIVQFK